MVSEDSLHRVAALATTVHRLAKSQHGDVVRIRQGSAQQDANGFLEACEILGLGPYKWEAIEERNDAIIDIAEVVGLPIPAAIASPSRTSTAERVPEELQWSPSLLRHVEAAEIFQLLP